jgi:hypothetical protein
MSRWLWILLAVIISTGVYFTIRYGLRPKPIPVLNPTEFQELKQIGVVLYKRLHQNIRTERIVMLGSSAEVKDYEQIWLGLAESALADKEKLVVFVREGMKPLPPIPGAEMVPFTMEQVKSGGFFKEVAGRLARKQLVVVHAWTPEATHLVKDSLSQKLDPAVRHPVLALSTLRFAIDEADIGNLQPQCLDASPDADELKRLHCAAYKVARKFLKKRLDAGRIWAVAERHGLKEFLVFIHQP